MVDESRPHAGHERTETRRHPVRCAQRACLFRRDSPAHLGRRVDGDEDHVGALDLRVDVRREEEVPAAALLDHLQQSRLVDGEVVGIPGINLPVSGGAGRHHEAPHRRRRRGCRTVDWGDGKHVHLSRRKMRGKVPAARRRRGVCANIFRFASNYLR